MTTEIDSKEHPVGGHAKKNEALKLSSFVCFAILALVGCYSVKKVSGHNSITRMEEKTMHSEEAIKRIEEAKKKLLPLDEVRRQALIDQALSWDDMYRDILKLAVVRAIEKGYSYRECIGLIRERSATVRLDPCVVASQWLSTLPQEVQSGEDYAVKWKVLVEHLPSVLSQETVDELLVVAATLNELTVDLDGSIQKWHDQIPLDERDSIIFGKPVVRRANGPKLTREEALRLLSDEPLLFLGIFKHRPPDRFLRAYAEALCEEMLKEGLVPDPEEGWVEDSMSLSSATGLVFDKMVSGDLEHPIVSGISEVLDDEARASVFVKALYDKCSGFLVRTSSGVEAMVPKP